MLSKKEQQRLMQEIQDQERGTTGEIVTVIADRSGDYRFYSLLIAAALSSLIVILLMRLAPSEVLLSLLVINTGLLFIIFEKFGWHRSLIPTSVLHRQAGLMAKRCWVDLGITRDTRDRTGVMIFVSEWEHYVEIIADKGLDHVISNEQWAVAVNRFGYLVKAGNIADAFLTTVQKIGALLNTFAPANTDDNPDELPNHLFRLSYEHDEFSVYSAEE